MSDQNDDYIPDNLAHLGDRISSQEGESTVNKVAEERKPPGIFMFLPPLLQEIWHKKVDFTIDASGSIIIDGFYKNGTMKFVLEGTQLISLDKRNRRKEINSFEDLVELNYSWWKQSISRTTYIAPEQPWLGFFVERKKVSRQIIYRPIDEDTNEE